jgi:outer membrane receptor for ferrienterochelin and colicins
MNYIKFLGVAMLLLANQVHAAMLHARIVDTDGKAIAAANLILAGSTIGTSSDLDGAANFHQLPAGELEFRISCVGYETKTIKYQLAKDDVISPVIVLSQTEFELDEIEVSVAGPDGLDISGTQALERIGSAELQSYSGGAGLLQALGDVNGVDSKPCGLCGSAGVGLQGLDPSYTEVNIDGLALLSGVGSAYGLESVRAQNLKSVELQRGSTDSRQSGAAIAGSVNLHSAGISEADTLSLNMALGDDLRHEIGLNLEKKILIPSRLSLNWSADPHRIDRNNDELTDTPQQGRFQVKLEQQAAFLGANWKWSLRSLTEQRFAGDVDWENENRGSATVYGRDIEIDRLEAVLHANWQDKNNRSWNVSQAWVDHRQDSWYGVTSFDAVQRRGLFKVQTVKQSEKALNRIEAGLSWEDYDDNLALQVRTDRLDRIPHLGIGQSRQINPVLAVDGGLRLEHHNDDGVIPLFRGNLRWQSSEEISMHFGVGQGFRQITLFSLDKAVHAGFDGVTLSTDLKPEQSLSLNYRLSWQRLQHNSKHSFSLGLFATEFKDKAVLAYLEESGLVAYSNASKAWSRGFNLSSKVVYLTGLSGAVDFNYSRVRYLQAGNWFEEHMVNRWTGAVRVNKQFSAAKTTVSLHWKIFGPQELPAGRSISESPIWQIYNLSVKKNFQNWQLGFDIENLFDWTQPDSPFINQNEGGLIDSALIYGPLIGRRFRLSLSFGL